MEGPSNSGSVKVLKKIQTREEFQGWYLDLRKAYQIWGNDSYREIGKILNCSRCQRELGPFWRPQ